MYLQQKLYIYQKTYRRFKKIIQIRKIMNEEKTFKEKLRTIISKIDFEKVTLEDFEKESYYNDVLPNFKKHGIL